MELRELDLPTMETGAPMPQILAEEGRLVLGYFLNEGVEDEACAIFKADHYRAFKFGPPNDEALSGHPYYDKGLGYYGVYEVLHSDWIAELEVANRVHSRHLPDLFLADRHFVFTFHDTTFELIAHDVHYTLGRGGPLKQIIEIFQND